ncbi:hypothetical protein [Yinghuangia seranimata]|uniref:hypothetical protein n=1 Tax=Yinghuangia seranimata TaxID=408067 RepID=UPI00248CC6A9|nr:hypothetical protein [Yinghuangia seranimata]MDI2131026.1 hypothetical protein [Yinghuangia seranimata]
MRRIAAPSAAILAVALLAACTGGEAKDNTKTDAKTLADQAVATMKAEEFLKLSGKSVEEDGTAVNLQGCVAEKIQGGHATGSGGGGKVEMIQLGKDQYIKADGGYWANASGQGNKPEVVAAFDKALNGRFVTSTDDNGFQDFFDGGTDGVVKGAPTEYAGQKVIPLVKEEDKKKTTLYVMSRGKPFIVAKVEEHSDSKKRQETTYQRTEDKCDVVAPPKDKTMTEDEFEKALSAATDNSTKDAQTLVSESSEHMKQYDSVQENGGGKDTTGSAITLDGCETPSGDGHSKVTSDGEPIDNMTVDGSTYFKGSKAFWVTQMKRAGKTDREADLVGRVLGGKYLRSEGADAQAQSMTYPAMFTSGKGVTKGSTVTFNGQKAIPLVLSVTGQTRTYFVAANGKPEVLGLREEFANNGGRVEITFKVTGEPCSLKAPSASEYLTQSQYQDALKAEAQKG